MDTQLPLKYQKNYSIIINDMDKSLYYYFDYDERSKKINMEFQHSHCFHEIMIPLSPNCVHYIEGIPYNLEIGDMVFLKPGLLHKTDYPAGMPSKRIVIEFWFPKNLFSMEDYYLPLLDPFSAKLPVFRLNDASRRSVFNKLDDIFMLSQTGNYIKHPEEHLILHSMFTEFLFLVKKSINNNMYTQISTCQAVNKKIYDIVLYIHGHYDEELSLDILADRFYISPCYLSHQFKKTTGFTLINYIQNTRINKAKDMLLSTENSISNIALLCGFQSFSQFNRIFRHTYNQSPSEMRHNLSKILYTN